MYQSCNFYHFLGPAYSIQTVSKENYVKAVGSFHDLIAIYEFKVAFTASYVVWKQTFATTNNTNDVSFRIDEGDWYLWRPPQKSSHALWTQYYFQVQGTCFITGSGLSWCSCDNTLSYLSPLPGFKSWTRVQ